MLFDEAAKNKAGTDFEDKQICFPFAGNYINMKIHSLAVFCGSHEGLNPVFKSDAIALGKLLAQQQITLVYGGGNVGLMGAIADTVMEAGGKVTGVIPSLLLDWERQHTGITELIVTDDMHSANARSMKKAMRRSSCPADSAPSTNYLKCSPGISCRYTINISSS